MSKDAPKAGKYYMKSMEKRDPRGMYLYAKSLEKGLLKDGEPEKEDLDRAFKLLIQAAEANVLLF